MGPCGDNLADGNQVVLVNLWRKSESNKPKAGDTADFAFSIRIKDDDGAGSPASSSIQISSVNIVQRAPGTISEAYASGWSLSGSISGTNPAGSTGGVLYVSVVPGENNPATFSPQSTVCRDTDLDIRLDNIHWLDAGTGTGGLQGFTLPAGVEEDSPFTQNFAFGVVCDDVRVEEPETFSVRMWFEAPGTSDGTKAHGGRGVAADFIIQDDDVAPQAPTGVQARGDADRIDIVWNEPANAVAARVQKYVLDLDGPGNFGENATPTATTSFTWHAAPQTFAGSYTVRVCASPSSSSVLDRVKDTCGDWSETVDVEFGTTFIPRPSGLSVSAGMADGSVVVDWTEVTHTSSLTYDLQYWRSGSRQPSAPNRRDISAPPQTVSGLDEGVVYRFRVRAVSGTDTSLWSEEAEVTVPGLGGGTDFSDPRDFTAAPGGSGSVLLSWRAPQFGPAPVRYRIERLQQASDNDPRRSTWLAVATPAGTATSFTVSGLQAGTHTFRLRAEVAQATRATEHADDPDKVSPWVQTTGSPGGGGTQNRDPVAGPFGPFTVVQGTPRDLDLSAVFTDPDGDDLEYQAATVDRRVATVSFPSGGGAAWSTSPILRLAGGTIGETSLTVRARDGAGGAVSTTTTVTVAAMAGKPAAPNAPVAVAGDRSVTLRWDPPADDGGSDVTGYVVVIAQLATGGCTGGNPVELRIANITEYTVPNLTNGCTYEFWIKAVNAYGDSPQSQFSTKATPTAGSADQPTSLTVEPRAGALLLSWGPPTGSTVPFDYQVSWAKGEGSWTPVPPRATGALSFEITGLEDGTEYRVRVRARYGAGGAASQSAWVQARARTLAAVRLAPVVATPFGAVEVGIDQSRELNLRAGFTDPDGDDSALTFAAVSVNPDIAAASVSGATLTITGQRAGTTVVRITATDSHGLSATQEVPVTVVPGPVNQPPQVATPLPAVEIQVGTTATVSLRAAFTDPEGDPLTITADTARPDVAAVSVSGGDLVVRGVQVGTSTVTVRATDRQPGGGRPVSQTFEVTVVPGPVNRPPEVDRDLPDVQLQIGTEARVSLLNAFRDAEGDRLAYMVVPDRTGIVSVSDVVGGSFTLRGVAIGLVGIVVSASDGRAGDERSAYQTFIAEVVPEPVNQPPVPVQGLEPVNLAVGETGTVDLASAFDDPEDDPLTYAVTSDRSEIAAVSSVRQGSPPSFTVRGVRQGEAVVTVSADDGVEGFGRPAVQRVEVVVGLAVPPRVENVYAVPQDFGVSASWDLLGARWSATYDVSLQAAAGGPEVFRQGLTGPPAVFGDLDPGQYRVAVRGVNAAGEGQWSLPALATVQDPGQLAIGIDGPDELQLPLGTCAKYGSHHMHSLPIRVSINRPHRERVTGLIYAEAVDPAAYAGLVRVDGGGCAIRENCFFIPPGETSVAVAATAVCEVEDRELFDVWIEDVIPGDVAIDPGRGRRRMIAMAVVPALPAVFAAALAAVLVGLGRRRLRRGAASPGGLRA